MCSTGSSTLFFFCLWEKLWACNQCLEGWIWPSPHWLTASICWHGVILLVWGVIKEGLGGTAPLPSPAVAALGHSAFLPGRCVGSRGLCPNSPHRVWGRNYLPLFWVSKGEGVFIRKRRSWSLSVIVKYWGFMLLWVIAVWMVVLTMLFFFPSEKLSFSSGTMGERRWELITIA